MYSKQYYANGITVSKRILSLLREKEAILGIGLLPKKSATTTKQTDEEIRNKNTKNIVTLPFCGKAGIFINWCLEALFESKPANKLQVLWYGCVNLLYKSHVFFPPIFFCPVATSFWLDLKPFRTFLDLLCIYARLTSKNIIYLEAFILQ